ncbi:hypothetical protein FH972_021142 [Carpinus fangiana]|uniref:Uncharacterized protein n=1 Tax=Carpinus fangiana TaxID=176857 RepID=A0A5N6KNN6_9ROSI|nr:hypothetical protein FH972_021142 [Carpinus fangiana]
MTLEGAGRKIAEAGHSPLQSHNYKVKGSRMNITLEEYPLSWDNMSYEHVRSMKLTLKIVMLPR